ncbi:MAG TPA: helix-turn-helix transcriptional regulator [Candidatus Limnocylindrales bacterium]
MDRGERIGRRALAMLGEEVRQGRTSSGLSQASLGAAIGMSHTKISRIERGRDAGVKLIDLARALAAVGLDVSVRAYPAGDPLRDAAHLALLDRLRSTLGVGLTWRTEVPLPVPGDLRSWDALIGGASRTAVEAETRLGDIQALERRLGLKQRDGGVDKLILLVGDTRANRVALRTGRPSMRAWLPCAAREILAALRAGRDPPGSGIVVL